MRVLNRKQKNILTAFFEEYHKKTMRYPNMEDLPGDLYRILEEINDHETIYQNIQSFLWDLRFKS